MAMNLSYPRCVTVSAAVSDSGKMRLVFPQPRSFCTELWRHTMPAQDEVAYNHTPHLFPPKADLLLPLGPGAGRFLLHDDASRVCHAACPRDATVAASKVG